MKEIKIEKLPQKLFALIGFLFIAFFMLFSCNTMNDRANSSVVSSRWNSSSGMSLIFYSDYGYYSEQDSLSAFSFLENDGFIKCSFIESDKSNLELNRLENGRMFCVTLNVMFYNMNENN